MSADPNSKDTVKTFYSRSYANVNLGIFLIFFGLIGAVPLYALAANIFFSQAEIEWRMGISAGILCIAAGYLFIKYSRRRFQVRLHPNGQGSIETQEGLFRPAIRFDFSPGAKIQLAAASSDNGTSRGELIQVTLIDGDRYYLIDSRPHNRLQESCLIAEFLSRSGSLKLLLPRYDNLELEPSDLDLSFCDRVKKYPTLISSEPQQPPGCPITVTDLNNGTDRRYSWGFRANGFIGQLLGLLMAAAVFACLPLFKEDESYCSLLSLAVQTKNFTYFYAGGAVIAFVSLVLLGLSVSMTVEGYRVNISRKLWGVTYKRRSLLVEQIEEIAAKERSSGCDVLIITEKDTVVINAANPSIANYLASDLRRFIAQR